MADGGGASIVRMGSLVDDDVAKMWGVAGDDDGCGTSEMLDWNTKTIEMKPLFKSTIYIHNRSYN